MKNLLMITITMVLIGCPSFGINEPKTTLGEEEVATSGGINGVYSGGAGYNPGMANRDNPATKGNFYDNSDYGENVVGGPQAPAKDRVIYFSYNSSSIDNRAETIVKAHYAYLKKHPNTIILLEGHTDSRGSREYNIALGERRTIAIMNLFSTLGIPTPQIRLISYGEEHPAILGYNEDAYKRNRRVVIQY